ncbi:MAG: chromosomal replication initiator protein DnaA, partial [Pseudomonadales bacterium]|nr:chromosomal replication initiator protein DnaA [Pseudomonadales bacterium]
MCVNINKKIKTINTGGRPKSVTLKKGRSIQATESDNADWLDLKEYVQQDSTLGDQTSQLTGAWQQCVLALQKDMPYQQYSTWIRPLQVEESGQRIRLMAPNRYVMSKVKSHYLDRICEIVAEKCGPDIQVVLGVGSTESVPDSDRSILLSPKRADPRSKPKTRENIGLNKAFTFESFVEGKSNEIARAAALQVSMNQGQSYNPLLLYGGVGLGKTHLMQAVGMEVLAKNPQANVVYLHSQRFVQDMVKALQNGTMQDFMTYYRNVDVLLIDDIQFFARKLRSQEEFFHVFNALLERGHQMVLTSDKYPKEIDGLEERLKSRFVWGLTVAVEPPDLETRVAILMKKAEIEGIDLRSDVAFFIAERIKSNVRELEGALKRVVANALFTGRKITVEQVKVSLRDMLAVQNRQVSIDNI